MLTFAPMDNLAGTNKNKAIAWWLITGVVMIMIQVLIGGITRLTESGLSITEWKPITGVLPPLNDAQWMAEFDKYRQTDQFKYVHQTFTLSDFKFIYFWEWFHRQWARLLGVVFIVGFVYFLAKKRFTKSMIWPMVILFLLGALQGLVGWIMVASGLVPEKYYVGHVELTTHFIAAIILLAYTLWFALKLLPAFQLKIDHAALRNWIIIIIALLTIQLMYGGFMAGLKAAQTAPTWPSINGKLLPAAASEMQPWYMNLFHNNLMIHFVHRMLAYLIGFIIIFFFIRSKPYAAHPVFGKIRIALLALTLTQVTLGIFTVLNGTQPGNLVWFGVGHQFVAMLMVMCLVMMLYLVRKPQRQNRTA